VSDSRRQPTIFIGKKFSVQTIIPLIIIGAVASGFSLVSYQYSVSTSDRIAAGATLDMKSNANTQAFDISKSLENRIDGVRGNLQILANSARLQNGEYEGVGDLIGAAEAASKGFTDSYFVVDASGKLRWAGAFTNADVYQQYHGADRSDRPYFIEPRDSQQPYLTTLRDSVDGVPRIYLGVPILKASTATAPDGGQPSSRTFMGVVVASINLKSIGSSLTVQLAPISQGAVSLMDRDGTILYTQNDSIIGKNFFSDEVQSLLFSKYLPASQKDEFNSMVRDSISGNAGVIEYSSSDVPLILAYQPITLDQGSGAKQHVMSLHLSMPKTFAADVAALIEQQRGISVIVPVVIGAIAVGIALLIIRSKWDLERIVKVRTAELESANQRLQDSERVQREFINIAAHELRTPIQPLVGMAEMLEGQFRKDGDDKIQIGKAEVEMISRNAKRLLNLSSDILEVSRIEGKSMVLNREVFDLKQKIEDVISDMRSVLPDDKAVKIRLESGDSKEKLEPLLVNADRERIFQVLSNLLSNSIKFTERGEIVITINKEDGQALVSVIDSGQGIAPEILPKLFTKFVTKSNRGTGLGLFIAKSIIDAHGGRIWGENNPNNLGARFTFSLPLDLEITPVSEEKLARNNLPGKML